MREVLLTLALLAGGCVDPVAPRWDLDHDHVVAARAQPPRLMPGETAVLDGLVAHAGAPVSIEQPANALAPAAPAELGAMVAQRDGAWVVTAPPIDTLATARPAMGLASDAPVPIDVVMEFGDLRVKKTVWLGAPGANPEPPAVAIDGAAAGDAASVPRDTDVYVSVEAGAGARVNWLTSCGELFQDDVATAFVRAKQACDGELAAIVRSPDGGVAWRVIALHAE